MLKITLVCSLALAVYSFQVYLKRRKYKHIPGPKPNSIFEYFLGNVYQISRNLGKGKIVPEQYLEWFAEYGSIFKFEVLNNFIVVVTTPQSIKDVLVAQNFPKPSLVYNTVAGYPFSERFLGSSLVSEPNEFNWQVRRKIFNLGFKNEFINESIKILNLKTDEFLEKLKLMADENTLVELSDMISELTLENISTITFGSGFDPEKKISKKLAKVLEGSNELAINPLMTINPLNFKKIKLYKQAIRDLRICIKKLILERVEKLKNNDYCSNDILSFVLIKLVEKNIDLEIIIDDVLSILNGGQETTANAILFCLLELHQHKPLLEKLLSEIENVLGQRNQIETNDLPKLEYLDCVFKETLRKYPSAVQFIRETDKDFELEGHFIPKKTWIAISPFLMGRNPNYFTEPDKFIPERFMKNEFNKIESFSFIPFSAGPRTCIGIKFAQIEAKIILVKLLKSIDFKFEDKPIRFVERITLKPADGCKCLINLKINDFFLCLN
uniref:Cytochrome p450 3049D1 n=1 Tax=Brachionus koreanus TaxID=1199090 RepID=W8SGS8_9BILA|nr:cytochrome p450 3049D1 [Brachionus koreanus]